MTFLADLGGYRSLDSVDVTGAFRGFVLGGGLRELVSRILEQPAAFAWCAARSHRHANNFDKIVLAEGGPGRRLVWHGWADPATAVPEQVEPHNHRWDFLSYVAAGELRAVEFDVVEDAAGPYSRHTYRSPGRREEYRMEYAGRAGLVESGTASHPSGTFYFQPHRPVHLAVPVVPRTASLILQSEVRSPTTDVFSRSGSGEPVERRVERLTPERLRACLSAIADRSPAG